MSSGELDDVYASRATHLPPRDALLCYASLMTTKDTFTSTPDAAAAFERANHDGEADVDFRPGDDRSTGRSTVCNCGRMHRDLNAVIECVESRR